MPHLGRSGQFRGFLEPGRSSGAGLTGWTIRDNSRTSLSSALSGAARRSFVSEPFPDNSERFGAGRRSSGLDVHGSTDFPQSVPKIRFLANVRLATERALRTPVSPALQSLSVQSGERVLPRNSHVESHAENLPKALEPIGRKTLNFVRRTPVAVPMLCVRILARMKTRCKMKRREFVEGSVALGLLGTFSSISYPAAAFSGSSPQKTKAAGSTAVSNPLTPPAHGQIPVAFVVSRGTVMIDLAGPWEVFNSVMIMSRGPSMDDQMPFQTYTVAESTQPVAMGGIKIIPDYTFANAPTPKIVVIPAQAGQTEAMLNWIRKATKTTDVTMSVCTGAFVLASTGLLAGKPATTHHNSYKSMAIQFPDISVQRGARFVESGNMATSGGLTSGIDLALHVVERYFGRKIAEGTAYLLEYQGRGWTDPASNATYLQAAVSTSEHPLCPVCGMEVDPETALNSKYKGRTYYFCSEDHKKQFDAAPEKWL